jgi:hypothetical protein
MKMNTPNETAPGGWHFHGETSTSAIRFLIKGLLPETGAALLSGQWGAFRLKESGVRRRNRTPATVCVQHPGQGRRS